MERELIGRSLLEAFAKVPDPRLPKGRRHPLPAILALATAAMLCGARSLYAIAQWGRLQEPAIVKALGFSRERTPAVSTLHLVFKDLDAVAFEAALRAWAQGHFADRVEAPALLRALPLEGRLVTGDALYCQRELCAQIGASGGDYLVIVKGNQRRLYEDISLLFSEPPPGEGFAVAKQWGRHGDRREVRRL